MQKRKLPIGIQTFSEIINEGYYYVDKTAFIHSLADQGKYYFLSRPRRFGKSLLLDTFKELFEANRALFAGLFIEDKWNWEKKFPVVRISFGDGNLRDRTELDNRISAQLAEIRECLGLPANHVVDIPGNFRDLLLKAEQKYKARVVVLIDEYDKPILDNITNPDIASEMRDGLRNFYSVIKGADAHIKFCFFTGVSKFSKVSLFSGLNNLDDITLDAKYSAICGYTDEDIDSVFTAEIGELSRTEIRRWYNGYNWTGRSVYNPFDLLLLFSKRDFKAYWFETATPTFLVDVLREREFFTPDLAKTQSDFELLGRFDVNDIGTEALLFQTGYLTIAKVELRFDKKILYQLGYPNHEVTISLNEALVRGLGVNSQASLQYGSRIISALQECNFVSLRQQLNSLYASIPHDWYRKNPIANYEGYYASIFYSHFAALGMQVIVEDSCSTGKVDMVIEFNNTIFIFEFKVVASEATGAALQQIRQKNYAEKYRSQNKRICLIGVEFSKAQRQIVGFEVE